MLSSMVSLFALVPDKKPGKSGRGDTMTNVQINFRRRWRPSLHKMSSNCDFCHPRDSLLCFTND